VVHRCENDPFGSTLQRHLHGGVFQVRIASGVKTQEEHLVPQRRLLSSLNDLTRKRRGGDIVTNETEHFRSLSAHMPGVMVGAVFQRLGRPQDTLPDLIFDMRTSVNDP
jgi:hypothetical protein